MKRGQCVWQGGTAFRAVAERPNGFQEDLALIVSVTQVFKHKHTQ